MPAKKTRNALAMELQTMTKMFNVSGFIGMGLGWMWLVYGTMVFVFFIHYLDAAVKSYAVGGILKKMKF